MQVCTLLHGYNARLRPAQLPPKFVELFFFAVNVYIIVVAIHVVTLGHLRDVRNFVLSHDKLYFNCQQGRQEYQPIWYFAPEHSRRFVLRSTLSSRAHLCQNKCGCVLSCRERRSQPWCTLMRERSAQTWEASIGFLFQHWLHSLINQVSHVHTLTRAKNLGYIPFVKKQIGV